MERILENVTAPSGGLKTPENALDVLRIMNANYSMFEISMIFDVILKTPTRSLR